MAELLPADVQTFTHGRLQASDPEVVRMLAAALSVARREVGWHVSPVHVSEAITLDGPDSRILWLPTLKLVELRGVTEDDTVLDLATIKPSAGDGPGLPRRVALRKVNRGWWTGEYGGLVVTMDHGYTEEEAADWRQAILSLVDQISLIPVKAATGMSDFGQSSVRVDDVQIGYNPYATIAQEVVFSIAHILDDYRLPSVEYL